MKFYALQSIIHADPKTPGVRQEVEAGGEIELTDVEEAKRLEAAGVISRSPPGQPQEQPAVHKEGDGPKVQAGADGDSGKPAKK